MSKANTRPQQTMYEIEFDFLDDAGEEICDTILTDRRPTKRQADAELFAMYGPVRITNRKLSLVDENLNELDDDTEFADNAYEQ